MINRIPCFASLLPVFALAQPSRPFTGLPRLRRQTLSALRKINPVFHQGLQFASAYCRHWIDTWFSVSVYSHEQKHGLEKIKTIGDAYMVAGGIPLPKLDHAEASAELALEMQTEFARLNRNYDTSIRLRIGICTGPVVAGVIGRKRFTYDLWGETVNFACRFEATGEAGKIQIAEATYEQVKHKYPFAPKHPLKIKGNGHLSAYWLNPRI